jgi:hypothetical protein
VPFGVTVSPCRTRKISCCASARTNQTRSTVRTIENTALRSLFDRSIYQVLRFSAETKSIGFFVSIKSEQALLISARSGNPNRFPASSRAVEQKRVFLDPELLAGLSVGWRWCRWLWCWRIMELNNQPLVAPLLHYDSISRRTCRNHLPVQRPL